MPTRIIGISAFYHDSAAALIVDGEIVAAAQEERFTRKKHDEAFPKHALAYCLHEGGVATAKDIDHVVFYDKPLVKFERILETYLGTVPTSPASFFSAMPVWLTKKLWMKDAVRDALHDQERAILFCEHHESHAASAFYPSPFEEAAVLTIDGVGEWTTTSMGVGRGADLTIEREIRFPHSIGLLYSAFTYYLGFKVNSGEYKVMGLAPYGQPRFYDTIMKELVDLRADGSFRLNQKYFAYVSRLRMTNGRFHDLFGGPPRAPESKLGQREMDLAASVQKATETCMLTLARAAHERTGLDNLCLAGGVALNCVGTGHILRETPFKRIFVQPAAGDAGGAIGAALEVWHKVLGQPRVIAPGARDGMKGSYLGPAYGEPFIREVLDDLGLPYEVLSDSAMDEACADLLASEQVLGWFQGRMEFGPRSLGGRSILGDPRSSKMQSVMNLKIKYRESFRPFAPSVLAERAGDYFDLDVDSPYMLLVAPVRESRRIPLTTEQQKLFGIDLLNVPRSDIPAVTHVDYSARVQTVHAADSPRYHALLSAFAARTGCAVLVNTSFNVRGEPIVESPLDAVRCFMRTEMDALAMGPCLLRKKDMPPRASIDHRLGGPTHLELD